MRRIASLIQGSKATWKVPQQRLGLALPFWRGSLKHKVGNIAYRDSKETFYNEGRKIKYIDR